jgi:glycosyltransferase involved in cell wall biosynthesis
MKICQAFVKNGHELTLIAPEYSSGREWGIEDPFSFYGVEKCFTIIYIPLLPVKGKGIIYGYSAGKKAKILQPDLVYGRELIGCFFSSLFELPVIFESHSPIEGFFNQVAFRKLISRPSFQNLVVITHALKEYYCSLYPALSDKIIIAADGADPISETLNLICLQKEDKRLQVGYIGHLYSGRGIDLIKQLAERCPWADFNIIGGTDNDIMACKMYTNLPNLTFHGFKTPAEADGYRCGCDVLLAPYQKKVSVSEGGGNTVKWMSPLKIFEYMAAGKAIICSDIPVIREILVDGQNALLCPSENIDSWEKALVLLSENDEIRKNLGETAKNDFLAHYTWSSRAKRVLQDIGK